MKNQKQLQPGKSKYIVHHKKNLFHSFELILRFLLELDFQVAMHSIDRCFYFYFTVFKEFKFVLESVYYKLLFQYEVWSEFAI